MFSSLNDEMNTIFKKRYDFKEYENHINHQIHDFNPFFSDSLWSNPVLDGLKNDINSVRRSLSSKDFNHWNQHTSFTDPSSFVVGEVKKLLKENPPELLTRAWVKFYEMLTEFKLIELNQSQPLNCLFLCEAPGAFVTATNHYIKSDDYRREFNWIATSLNPYYEGSDVFGAAIVDDRFIRNPYSYKNWFFGPKNTGNILELSFLESLKKNANQSFDLVTADGGVNCSECPENQEKLTLPIIIAEVTIGLTMLKNKGCLILKVFSPFETQSLGLIYFLSVVFEEVHAFKPVLSKSGNSEIYLICKQFKKDNENVKLILTKLVAKLNYLTTTVHEKCFLKSKLIPDSFVKDFIECSTLFLGLQKDSIQRNLQLYMNVTEYDKKSLVAIKKLCSRRLLQKINLQTIPYPAEICKGTMKSLFLEKELDFNFQEIEAISSFNGNSSMKKSLAMNDIPNLLSSLERMYDEENLIKLFGKWFVCSERKTSVCYEHIDFVYGDPFYEVKCSTFSNLSLLTLYNTLSREDIISKVPQSNSIMESMHRCVADSMRHVFRAFVASSTKPISFIVNVLGTEEETSKLLQNIKQTIDLPTASPILEQFGCDANQEPEKTHFDNFSTRKIYVIDPISGSSFGSKSMALNRFRSQSKTHEKLPDELSVLCLLLPSLNDVLPTMQEDDLLVLHLYTLLTRLTASMLYLLTRMFNEIAVIPCYTAKEVESTCCSDQPLQGQLVLFSGKKACTTASECNRPVNANKTCGAEDWVIDTLKKMSNSIEPSKRSLLNKQNMDNEAIDINNVLLEVIPLPVMIEGKYDLLLTEVGKWRDVEFHRLIKRANNVFMATRLKIWAHQMLTIAKTDENLEIT